MTEGMVIDVGIKAVTLVILLAGPMLGFGLVAGLIVAVFQAVTSIQEMTLTFVPKIIAVLLAMALFGNWMLQNTLIFTTDLLMNLPNYVR